MPQNPAPTARAQKQQNVALRPELHARIKELAKRDHRTIAGTIEHAIAELESR